MKAKADVKVECNASVKDEKKIKLEPKLEHVPLKEVKKKVKSECAIGLGGSPFPEFNRPHVEECLQVVQALTALHGVKETQNSIRPVLDALVRTILSQNTTDKTSMVAFQNLKQACPTWKSVLDADDSVIEDAIRFGGLAEIKTKRIKIILRDILDNHSEFCIKGEPSLEWMRALPTADVKAKLGAYNGVGPKTISCVLMFAMERPEFPVDTHVWHITKKLGWVPQTCSRESCYEHLNSRVPDSLKFALHVLLVDHGKVCKACTKNGGAKSSKKGEAVEVPCPLRRNGEHISFSPDVTYTKKGLLDEASCSSSSSCMDKIKREYHVKDEDTKDEKIKAEPGHHDKISMGLFPSDVKKESDHSHIKTEIPVKCENTKKPSVLVKTESTAAAAAAAESSSKETCLKSVDIESDNVAPQDAVCAEILPAGERRGRSAKRSVESDAPVDEILFIKRRGAILR